MAKHTITVIHRSVGESNKSKVQSKQKKTSSLNKTQSGGVSKKNKQQTASVSKSFQKYKQYLSGGLAAAAAVKLAQTSINIYAGIGDAATGNSLYYNNLRSKASLILNPISSVKEIATEAILGNLRIQRENRGLDYQRQLTGSLAFSRKTSSGTF